MVKPAQYLETSVGIYLSQILGGNKATGMNVGQVNDIYPSRFARFLQGAKKRPLPWE